MQEKELRPGRSILRSFTAIAFLLACFPVSSLPHPQFRENVELSAEDLDSSSSPNPQFHEKVEVSAEDLDFSAEDVVAFSNATANGVRREGVDTALRKYAFMALSHARTGIIYNVSLPPFLDGIFCQAIRVRAGSARKRGLVFNEFTIPQGMIVQTGGPFVIMVYRKIFNFTLYSPPPEYDFASATVGIVVYTYLNTTLDDSPLPEMTVLSPNSSIEAKLDILYESLGISPSNRTERFACAYYDINGTASYTNISTYPNICSFKTLTDVAIIIPLSAVPVAAPPPVPPPPPPPIVGKPPVAAQYSSNAWQIVTFAVLGSIGGLALLIFVIVMGTRVVDECRMTGADEPLDEGEMLQTSLIGHTRAPTAIGMRTKPVLETGSLQT